MKRLLMRLKTRLMRQEALAGDSQEPGIPTLDIHATRSDVFLGSDIDTFLRSDIDISLHSDVAGLKQDHGSETTSAAPECIEDEDGATVPRIPVLDPAGLDLDQPDEFDPDETAVLTDELHFGWSTYLAAPVGADLCLGLWQHQRS
jgi:hypothetical protein